jgi:hypothetical protein
VDTVRTTSSAPQISFDVTANVTSQNPISSVTVSVFNPLNEAAGVFTLSDAGSGVFTGNITLSGFSCLLVGNYKIQIVAEDQLGLFSNLVVNNLPVVNTANQPPTVSGLIAPDTIVVPPSGSNINVLSILANDLDGYCDIQSVVFNTFLPNGQPATGNPFTLFDDGNIEAHGDTIAMDSRFSQKIEITSAQTLVGNFVFKYKVTDRSGISSTELIDTIVVKFP